ncbi:energy transducer TonB [Pseudoluteimonas lycopersici]|uniref:Energy transducer TonB n=1 Tax=Pseudoluteimonas lycopersici TaxID=1324796 RepID=A0A516V376_9GAMM|nr:energy transducer TonB [Lysobacter lycopersici]QDQ72963.1 energy transducer TonB [Lysobacter lycopersici]
MSETPSNSPPPRAGLRLSRRNLLIIAAAFGIGLLLFLLLWAGHRNDNDFYRADAPVAGPSGQVFEPLPVPMPADEAGNAPASDDEDRAPGMVGIDETRPATPAPAPRAPVAPPSAPTTPIAPAQANSDPVLQGKPAAPYPVAALRNGESGTVMLRVTVGADGVPYGIAVARSSGSRTLDRAAMGAVKSWRFNPAMHNGQPVPASVQIPVSYNLGDR